MAYEINRDAVSTDFASVQAFLLRKGDDQIRTGVLAHRADCLRINLDALESNGHSHGPVLQRPTSATRKAALNGEKCS